MWKSIDPIDDSYNNLSQSTTPEIFEKLDWYSPAAGFLKWLAKVRPQISFATSTFAQFSTNPNETHITVMNRVFRYINGTKQYQLVFGTNPDAGLNGFVDSNWGRCIVTYRSTTGYMFSKSGGIESHSSKRQETVSVSSTEVEYFALSQATKEAALL